MESNFAVNTTVTIWYNNTQLNQNLRWVDPCSLHWVSHLNPTYDIQAFNIIWSLGAKPNKSIQRFFILHFAWLFIFVFCQFCICKCNLYLIELDHNCMMIADLYNSKRTTPITRVNIMVFIILWFRVYIMVQALSFPIQSPTQCVIPITTMAIMRCSPTIFQAGSLWDFAIK